MNEDDFSFDHDTHTYRNWRGEVRPSVTQTLQAGGLFKYDRVPPELLERKRIIGQAVHAWTAEYDTEHEPDLCSLTAEEEPYAKAWLLFRREFPFTVLEVEKKMLRELHGIELGGTLDRKVRMPDGRIFYLDLKCCESFHPAWRLQLADYVMLDTGRPTCAAYGRATVRLSKRGLYKLDTISPEWDQVDSAVATAFVQTYAWKYNHKLL